jgi:hypothetical protein
MQKFVPAALFLALFVTAGCQEPVKEELSPSPTGRRAQSWPADVLPGDPPPKAEDFGTDEEAAYFRPFLRATRLVDRSRAVRHLLAAA